MAWLHAGRVRLGLLLVCCWSPLHDSMGGCVGLVETRDCRAAGIVVAADCCESPLHACPSLQIAGATLDKCEGSGRSPAVGTRQLTLHGIHHLPSLQRLAEAVLPAGTPPSSLQSLSIFHSRLRTAALLNCAHLAQLTRLLVSVTEFEGGGGPQAGIAALLQQAPRLQSLTLLGCFRGHPVPPAVAACTGLRRLSLQDNKLADLPDGPYLTGECVRLTGRYPPELHLSVCGSRAVCVGGMRELAAQAGHTN